MSGAVKLDKGSFFPVQESSNLPHHNWVKIVFLAWNGVRNSDPSCPGIDELLRELNVLEPGIHL